jgi:hypothetical protein
MLHLAYVHDSADPRSLALAAVLVPDELWTAVRDRLIAFRRKLKASYGFLLRYEGRW